MIASRRTAASGGANAQAANVTDLFNAIDLTLKAAGWTASVSGTTTFYSSTGESGNEKLNLIMQLNSGSNFLRFLMAQFVDGSLNAYNQIGNTVDNQTDLLNLTTQTYDYVVAADLNGFGVFIRSTGATIWQFSAGFLNRTPDANANVMITNAAISAGSNVVVDVTPSNPAALGYQVGDIIAIVSQQTTGPSANIIPVFNARIVSIGTNSVTLDTVPSGANGSVSAGARIGDDPMPYYMTMTNSGGFLNLEGANPGFTGGYSTRPGVANLFTNSPSNGTATGGNGYRGTTRSDLSTEFTQLAPNTRTARSAIVSYDCYDTGPSFRGTIDKLFGSSEAFTLWDTARTIKTSPTHDYILFNSGANWFAVGPIV